MFFTPPVSFDFGMNFVSRVCVCVCVRVKRKGKKLLVIIIMFEKLVLQSHKTKTNQRMNLRRTEYFPVRNEWFIRYISVFHSYRI